MEAKLDHERHGAIGKGCCSECLMVLGRDGATLRMRLANEELARLLQSKVTGADASQR